MKTDLKFNHDADDLISSFCTNKTAEEINDKIVLAIINYVLDDSLDKKSHLAEILHKKLDYNAILFLAVAGVCEKMKNIAVDNIDLKDLF